MCLCKTEKNKQDVFLIKISDDSIQNNKSFLAYFSFWKKTLKYQLTTDIKSESSNVRICVSLPKRNKY